MADSAQQGASDQTGSTDHSTMAETIHPENEGRPVKERWWRRPEHLIQIAILTFVALYTVLTFCLLLTSRDTEQRQLRAYMGIEFGAVLLDSPMGGAVTAWLRFKNYGATPAYKLTAWHKFDGLPTNESPFPQRGTSENQTVLGPSATINMDSTLKINPDELQAVKNKNLSFFVWGRIEYIDAFKNSRYFDFKARMNGEPQTVMIDNEKAKGWGLNPVVNGFDAN